MNKAKSSSHSASADTAIKTAGSTIGTILKVIGTIFLIFVLSVLIFACIFALYIKTEITPSIDIKLEDFALNQTSSILYNNGTDWVELKELDSSENRVWIDYEDIPQNVEHAVVAVEDKRFYKHKGVDWYRTIGAFFNMFLGVRSDFGGSTITQQLIKNLTRQDDITVQRKLLEICEALELEKRYDKSEIMEWYLNAVYFGEGCYGVEAAAQTYFGKSAKDLDLAECASIAGITNLPTYYDPYYSRENNKKRQEDILYLMYDQGYITKEEYESAKSEELNFIYSESSDSTYEVYSYYEEAVISDVLDDLVEQKGLSRDTATQLLYRGGYKIYSCFDPTIQSYVDEMYSNFDNLPSPYYEETDQQLESAIVIIKQSTGEIVALSGGTGSKDVSFGLNRAMDSQRPPGSSIKPIAVYGPAVEYGLITPSTKVMDSANIKLKGTDWMPSNSGGGHYGLITILQGLQHSLNTVSAQILDVLTPSVSYDFLIERLGVKSLDPADCDYAPIALGQLTYGITVREMAQAYAALANDGTFIKSKLYTKVTDANGNIILDNTTQSHQAFSANSAHVMSYMLEYAATYGTGYEASFSGMSVAGKTGTTSDSCDRWFCGYTPYYTAAVWVGYDTPSELYFSGNPASQIWRSIMEKVHADLPYAEFPEADLGEPTGMLDSYYTNSSFYEEESSDDTVSPSPSESTQPEETDTGGVSETDIGSTVTSNGGTETNSQVGIIFPNISKYLLNFSSLSK